jgi:hypothetical protein
MANSRFGLRTKRGLISSVIESTYFDADTIAFIDAAAITDATQQSALNTLVISLKTNSIWTKIKAAYPLIGGTSASHKFNLKNPLDTDAAFRLTFSGGWTHDANGITGNGLNSYANTFFKPSVQYANANSSHLSNYCKTNSSGAYLEMGCQLPGSAFKFYNFYSGTAYISLNDNTSSTSGLASGRADAMMTASRTSSTSMFVKRNNSTEITLTSTSSSLVTQNLYLGALNNNGVISPAQYTNRTYGWFSIGDGLTTTEATNLNLAVQQFQLTLGRQV